MRSSFRRNFGIFSVENWGTKSLQAHQAPDFRMRKAMLCAAMRSMFHTVWVCLGVQTCLVTSRQMYFVGMVLDADQQTQLIMF